MRTNRNLRLETLERREVFTALPGLDAGLEVTQPPGTDNTAATIEYARCHGALVIAASAPQDSADNQRVANQGGEDVLFSATQIQAEATSDRQGQFVGDRLGWSRVGGDQQDGSVVADSNFGGDWTDHAAPVENQKIEGQFRFSSASVDSVIAESNDLLTVTCPRDAASGLPTGKSILFQGLGDVYY